MTLEDLRVFVQACEVGSLSGLAKNLGRTQSAVSQHISRLEAELGVALFERQARGVTPTQAGRILWELALEGLDAIETGLSRIRALRDGEAGTLTITTGGTTVRHFMQSAVVRFRREHPAVNLRFLPASSTRRCFEILRLQQADLAFVTTGEAPRGINELTVARQCFFLLVSESDPLAKRKRLKIADLRGLRYLGLSEGTTHRGAIERAAAEQGVQLEPEVTFDDFDTASIFVELDLGQAIVPAVQAHNFERDGGVRGVRIADLPPVSVGWAFRHWSHLSTPARDFVELFKDELAQLGDMDGLTLVD
jgi:DNA-binding transcriptional LysR family regulator